MIETLRKVAKAWSAVKAGWTSGAFKPTDHDALSYIWGNGTYAGKSVDEVSAMQASAVFGCVRGISETCATLPCKVYEKDREGNAIEVDHPLAEILTVAPNADMTDVEFREAQFANIALQGNSYARIERRGGGEVSSLYPIPANHCAPRRNSAGEIEYRVNERGRWETLPREKIWHVKGFGSNGLMGYSPITMMRQAIGLSLATEEFGARFFSQGASTSGIVTFPNFLSPEQRLQAREVLKNKYEGLGQAHKLMVLEGGMTYTPVSMNLDDAEYLLLRGFQVDEICRMFRYPPHMVAKMDRTTFSNIEQQAIEFVVHCLRPYLVRFERSAQRWLLKPGERSRFFVRFNVEGLLRGDSAARAAFYASMLQNGVYSRNEVRALENLNQVDGQGMDDYTVQSNMIDVNDLAKLLVGKSAAPGPVPEKSAPVEIRLSSFEETVGIVGKALQQINHGQAQLSAALGELAKSHDGIVDATVVLARETSRNAKRIDETNVAIQKGLTDLTAAHQAERVAVFDDQGNVVGSRIKPLH